MKTVITPNSSLLTIIPSRSTPILIAITFMAFALTQKAQAVNPPPDGGYPGGNTAEGQGALLNLTSGTFNTAVGLFSLRSNTEGKFNTAVGAGTLFANTADNNTATGAGALLSNTISADNTATGAFALLSNTTGFESTACGSNALVNSTTGGGNTAMGFNALPNNTTGVTNTALGFHAGFDITTADNVIVIGTNVAGQNVDHSCFIGEIFGKTSSSVELLFSLTQKARWARLPPPGASKTISSQSIRRANHSLRSNRLSSVTKRKLIRRAHRSSDLWPRT